MKLTSILIILLFAFTLVACGGGGSSSVPDASMMPGDGDGDSDMEPEGPTEQAKIMGLTMAIADPDGDGKFPEPNELSNRRPDTGVTIMFGNGGSATVDGDGLGKNDPTIKDTMEFQMKTESRASVSGFKPSVHERTKDGKTDTLTLYTNAHAPKSQEWNVYYAEDRDGVTVGDAATVPSGTSSYKTITISAATLSADVASRIKGPMIGKSIAAGENNALAGMFHGAPGKYTCSADTCTLNEAANGAVTLAGGNLVFTPSNTKDDTQDRHMIEGVELDMDYLSFGYWVQTMSMGEEMKYSVGTFYGGMPEFPAASIGNLTGKATYDGSATGLYARKDLSVVDGEVVGTPAAAGQFTADVNLTANFGVDDDVAAGHTNRISGMVDNFHDANGGMIADWTLKLDAAMYGTSSGTENTFSGDTGTGDMIGKWVGMFYGDDADSAMPSGVAGEFTGHFNNGHVIGAFGATESE